MKTGFDCQVRENISPGLSVSQLLDGGNSLNLSFHNVLPPIWFGAVRHDVRVFGPIFCSEDDKREKGGGVKWAADEQTSTFRPGSDQSVWALALTAGMTQAECFYLNFD